MAGDAPGVVFTVGHSTREGAALVALLRENGVRVLVDVRRFPGSRRHPQFGRHALSASLAEAGITYRHAEALGGRRDEDASPTSPNTAWRGGFRAYADHTATPAFRAALQAVMDEARARPLALMCAEANPAHCHRSLITDVLLARGVPVHHILAPGDTRPAGFTPHAVAGADGAVTWPATPQHDLFGG